jgi:uncharacterized protein (TIGR02145 family)
MRPIIIIAFLVIALSSACSKKATKPDDSIQYGTLTDSRDGRIYKTITIGSQTWMAENLNVGTRVNGSDTMKNNNIIEKHAYNNNETYADTYGGLYKWDEAMQYDTTEGAQGICPDGWHIPLDVEWTILTNYVGGFLNGSNVAGTALKQGGSSGFQALFSGYSNSIGQFIGLGSIGAFWSSSQRDTVYVWNRCIFDDDTSVRRFFDSKSQGNCVRCMRNQ